jgi:hypothetical protein
VNRVSCPPCRARRGPRPPQRIALPVRRRCTAKREGRAASGVDLYADLTVVAGEVLRERDGEVEPAVAVEVGGHQEVGAFPESWKRGRAKCVAACAGKSAPIVANATKAIRARAPDAIPMRLPGLFSCWFLAGRGNSTPRKKPGRIQTLV